MGTDIIDNTGVALSEGSKRMIRSLRKCFAKHSGNPSITFEETFVEAKKLFLGPKNFCLVAQGLAEWDFGVFMECADIPGYVFYAYGQLQNKGLIAAG